MANTKFNFKELLKYAAGITTWEALIHLSFLLSGAEPTIFGITLTNGLNIIQTIMPGVASALLIYFAWFNNKK